MAAFLTPIGVYCCLGRELDSTLIYCGTLKTKGILIFSSTVIIIYKLNMNSKNSASTFTNDYHLLNVSVFNCWCKKLTRLTTVLLGDFFFSFFNIFLYFNKILTVPTRIKFFSIIKWFGTGKFYKNLNKVKNDRYMIILIITFGAQKSFFWIEKRGTLSWGKVII